MKVIFFSILLSIFLSDNKPLISLREAENVLGQPARLTENSEQVKNGVRKIKANYTGLGDTTVHLYSLSSRYGSEPDAQKAYSVLVTGNANMTGFSKITDLGDEGFFHSDNLHFDLVIFRKANMIITLKVNRISSHTSVAELRKLAGKLGSGR